MRLSRAIKAVILVALVLVVASSAGVVQLPLAVLIAVLLCSLFFFGFADL
jgi:hypothetical protein